jgi:hypothetical protein
VGVGARTKPAIISALLCAVCLAFGLNASAQSGHRILRLAFHTVPIRGSAIASAGPLAPPILSRDGNVYFVSGRTLFQLRGLDGSYRPVFQLSSACAGNVMVVQHYGVREATCATKLGFQVQDERKRYTVGRAPIELKNQQTLVSRMPMIVAADQDALWLVYKARPTVARCTTSGCTCARPYLPPGGTFNDAASDRTSLVLTDGTDSAFRSDAHCSIRRFDAHVGHAALVGSSAGNVWLGDAIDPALAFIPARGKQQEFRLSGLPRFIACDVRGSQTFVVVQEPVSHRYRLMIFRDARVVGDWRLPMTVIDGAVVDTRNRLWVTVGYLHSYIVITAR